MKIWITCKVDPSGVMLELDRRAVTVKELAVDFAAQRNKKTVIGRWQPIELSLIGPPRG
jgi:hypothetical protein